MKEAQKTLAKKPTAKVTRRRISSQATKGKRTTRAKARTAPKEKSVGTAAKLPAFYTDAITIMDEQGIEPALLHLYQGMHEKIANEDYAEIDALMERALADERYLDLNIGLLSSSGPKRQKLSQWEALRTRLAATLKKLGEDPEAALPLP